jgi:hypothetical protein
MGQFLINIHDGTVCDLAGTVIVDTDKLDEAGKALLHEWNEGGNDSTASELGEKYGTSLEKFTDNTLTYGNTMAFDVRSMKDEVLARIEGGFDDEVWQRASTLTDEQLEELGLFCINNDYLWTVFGEVVSDTVHEYVGSLIEEEKK